MPSFIIIDENVWIYVTDFRKEGGWGGGGLFAFTPILEQPRK